MNEISGRHIVITGLMGVGKSTTSTVVGSAMGWPDADSDDDIELLLGISGRDLADEEGIAALHRIEAAVLLGALARPQPRVIGAAASVVEDVAVEDLRLSAAEPVDSLAGRIVEAAQAFSSEGKP